ncbi:hypothetical protein TSAR_004903 [Trichomalopsis sarcophagae]|uniref:Uncharacterized protein n=1 Tax=Trichomalopsis sarcophagae TaxID=543379 RepID=A0A232FBU2_9HYME|nr:hypothetical protein TSAR_004903 [Trichomalopsis sarcophagae]
MAILFHFPLLCSTARTSVVSRRSSGSLHRFFCSLSHSADAACVAVTLVLLLLLLKAAYLPALRGINDQTLEITHVAATPRTNSCQSPFASGLSVATEFVHTDERAMVNEKATEIAIDFFVQLSFCENSKIQQPDKASSESTKGNLIKASSSWPSNK